MITFVSDQKQIGCQRTSRSALLRKTRSLLLLLFAASAVLFCSPLLAGAHSLVVGMDDHGSTIEMSVGEILVVELPGNAGTGFNWEFDHLDGTLLSLMCTDKKIEREGEPDFVGNAYIQFWVVKAVEVGTTPVVMYYYRPWEGKEMAEKKFAIEVVVNP